MDFLIAKTKGKNGSFYLVLSDKTTFDELPDFKNVQKYNDEYKLHDDEWFVVDRFSEQSYCIDFLKKRFAATSYSFLPKDKYEKIDYIVSIQEDSEYYIFQKVTPSLFYAKQKSLSWEHITSPTDQAVLLKQNNILVIKNTPDCYYIKDSDKLYFKNLNAITTIFDGINILYREATNQEVEDFLGMGMIDVAPGFGRDNVKTANRRRIKEALERYNSFSEQQKEKIPSYIGEYCPHIYDKETKLFKVTDENSLTEVLNVLNQRYYTTEIDGEKRLANSVTKIIV